MKAAWLAALAVAAVSAFAAADGSREASPMAQYAADPGAPVRCGDGMVVAVKASDATPACVSERTAAALLERGWASQITEPARPAKADAAQPDRQAVKDAVAGALRMYDESGEAALEAITASAAQYAPPVPYVFVLELAEPPVVAAHGALPERVGAVSKSLTEADRPYGQILEDLRSGGTWVEYVFVNPETGADQSKTSWLVMRGGYAFGSGYYTETGAQAAKEAVAAALAAYEESGEAALEAVTASAQDYDSSSPYVFVLETSEPPVIRAHGAFPERVGTTATPLLQADRPYSQILEDARSGPGTWTEYVFANPATGSEQAKKSWLVASGQYVFGSGYYADTDRQAAKKAVAEALAAYDESGEAALKEITASAADYDSSEPYVFVLELAEPPVVAAHGALPERVGAVSKSLTTADRPYEQILEDLGSGGTWVKYVFANPATGDDQSKKSWLVMRGQYVFGSGYYEGSAAWESAAKEAVSGALAMYEEDGEAALEAITASAQGYDSSEPYVFVVDGTGSPKIVAHGAFSDRVGTDATPLLEADRPYDSVLEELRAGQGAWIEYAFPNPATGLEQAKRSWLMMGGQYVFGSGYYTETDAQAVKRTAEEAAGLFEAHGDGVLESITRSADDYDPSRPYVFVLDGGDEPLILAHGAFPERVGMVSDALTAADRPYGQILADLRSGGTWVEYVFVNPATGDDQVKRSWLEPSGPYVFGSGYYLPGSDPASLQPAS